MCSRSRSGSKPGRHGVAEAREKRIAIAAAPDVVAHLVGLVEIQDDEEAAVREGERLRGGRLRLLVPHLAVNDRREPVLRVALHVLPDVQHRAAGRIHHHAADVGEALHLGRRDAERRQHDHVVGAQRLARLVGVAQKLNAFAAEAIVDVRVVDDFAGQKHAAVGKSLARLIGIVDGAVDAVAEAELAREMDRETAGPVLKVVGLDLLNEIAVVVLIQLGRDRIFQVEALAEHERRGALIPERN